MKFGAPVWLFRWDEPYDQAIRRISSLGFRAVELIAWTREVLDTRPASIWSALLEEVAASRANPRACR